MAINNVEKYEDIIDLIEIIRRKKIEKKPTKEFVEILTSNLENIKELNFEGYVDYLTSLNSSLSKKDIFTNTRYIFTGNSNGPSVKDLFIFFGIDGLIKIINDLEAI